MKRTSFLGTLWNSMFPSSTEIKDYPLLRNYQQYGMTRFLRGIIKIVGLPFSRLLDLSSPIILGKIIQVFDQVGEGEKDQIDFLGYTWKSKDLFYFYTFIWLGGQWLSQNLNYLIESDGVLVSRMRLTEYIIKHDMLPLKQKNRPTGFYLDEIKGIDRAAREGSKLAFDIWASITEFFAIIGILVRFYSGEFGLSYGVAPTIYALTSLLDIYFFIGFSMPIKNASKNFMEIAEEIISNNKTMMLYSAEEKEEKAYDEAMSSIEGRFRAKMRVVTALSLIQKGILAIGLYSIVDQVGKRVLNPISPYDESSFVVLTALYFKLIAPLGRLGDTIRELLTHMAYFKAFVEKINLDISLDEGEDFDESKPPTIVFNGVDFKYPERRRGQEGPLPWAMAWMMPKVVPKEKTVVENIAPFSLNGTNFQIDPGQITALQGENGSGKSTIIDLIYRFYEPDRGGITINGININTINLTDLRAKIAICSQSAHIFSFRTIRENILYGEQEETNETIPSFLSQRAPQQVIIQGNGGLLKGSDNPHGLPIFDELGENKRQSVSGGQAHQINFIRTMLKTGVKIFIFDEPTAALDANARRVVLNAIQSLRNPDKIVIIVSHHKDELQIADKIIKIQKGKIISEIPAPTEVTDQKEEEDKSIIASSPIVKRGSSTDLSVPLLSDLGTQTFSFQSLNSGPSHLQAGGGKNLNSVNNFSPSK